MSNHNLSSKDKQRRRRAVISRDGEECARCGTSKKLTIDHIIPRCLGGTNEISNLQLLCRACNSAKGDRGIDYRAVAA